MNTKNKSVFGIFKNQVDLDKAVELLKLENFSNNDISVLFPDNKGTHSFAMAKETKAPEGAATGASAGLFVGGALGWLIGIGSLAIPGVGPFIAAGPIMASLAGASVGGLVGGISGALVGFGIPEYEAKRYEGFLKEGGILLSVHCEDSEEISRAEELLKQTGASDIASAGETSIPHQKQRDKMGTTTAQLS